jgi:phage tail-like protein
MPVGDRIEVHTSFRFVVKIDEIAHAAFTECNLPTLQVETQALNEGGQNAYVHTLPVRIKAGTVTLKHGVTRDGKLFNWYRSVLNGYLKDALRTVTVEMYDYITQGRSAKMEPVFVWRFERAYPIKYSGPHLRTGEQALAVEEIEIAHHGFEVGEK